MAHDGRRGPIPCTKYPGATHRTIDSARNCCAGSTAGSTAQGPAISPGLANKSYLPASDRYSQRDTASDSTGSSSTSSTDGKRDIGCMPWIAGIALIIVALILMF